MKATSERTVVLVKHTRPARNGEQPVPSKQCVSAIKPGLNSLHEKEIGHRKKCNRAQQ